VEVTVTPRTLALWLVPAFSSFFGFESAATTSVGATAVAGIEQYACDIAPVMFCSPNGAAYTVQPGRQTALQSQNSWGPGAFGLLDSNFDPDGPCKTNTGADAYRCSVGARQNLTRCFARRGVCIRPGQLGEAAASGFNTRFDMYETSLNSKKNDWQFAPAPNVVKGIGPSSGNKCDWSETYTDSMALPRDDCFAAGTCDGGNRFGNGQWDKAGYWAKNHGGGTPPDVDTRYEMYLWEIANAPNANRILPTPREETGRPTCSSETPAGPERRLLNAAVIDCSNLTSGNQCGVPVLKFVRVFMTEPAGKEGSDDTRLWVEEVEELTPGGPSGVIHDVVQLRR
jgi:hypothetical protein